jgi:hypothetical protein
LHDNSERFTSKKGSFAARIRITRGELVRVYLQCPAQPRQNILELTFQSNNTVLDLDNKCFNNN